VIGDRQFTAIEALDSTGHPLAKFFRGPAEWMRRAHQRAIALGLSQGPKRWILDVGSAIPYFAAACDLCGHDVLSIDVPDPLVEQAARILGYDFIGHVITPRIPLPKLPHRFDLITCFGVNMHADGRDLSFGEYAGAVDAMIAQLNPGGRVVVAPNRGWLGDRWRLVTRWRKSLRARARITNQNDWITFEMK
jgi:SAM-dependent methyltransferase